MIQKINNSYTIQNNNTAMPLVSIIVTVYNVDKYISQCLESLIHQSYKNIEIICVDDCSTDGSYDILCQYKNKYANIIVSKNKTNSGCSLTVQHGYDLANGNYIMSVDADDMLDLDACSTLVKLAKKYNLDLIQYLPNIIFDFDASNEFKNSKNNIYALKNCVEVINKNMSGIELANSLFDNNSYIDSVCLKFIKRDLILANNIKWHSIVHADNIMSYELFTFSKRSMQITDKLYIRRYRAGSIMMTYNSNDPNKLIDSMYRLNYLKDQYSLYDKQCNKKFIKRLYQRIHNEYKSILQSINKNIEASAQEILK